MKEKMVTIVDYGLGNLYSIKRAVESLSGAVAITSDPDAVIKAERIIMPGVGAFSEGMANLAKRNLITPIKDFAASGRPLLGICLGMQLLMDESEELGMHKGLGIIGGKVRRLRVKDSARPHKIPHIGWNAISENGRAVRWDATLLTGVRNGSFMYFVHSFAPEPDNHEDALAITSYGEYDFCSAIQRGSVCGCQFHPEKSGPAGLMVLKNFLQV